MKRDFWFMRQAGRYLEEYRNVREGAGGFLKLCFSPELASEVTLQPIRRFDFSHAIIFSDILTIPYALGYDVKIDEQKGGPLVETIKTIDDIWNLEEYDDKKLKAVLEAIRLTRKNLQPNKKLIGFCGAPWTIAVYMLQGRSNINNQETYIFSYKHKDAFKFLIEHLTNSIIDYLSKQIEAGCDTIQLFDSWANMMPSGLFEEYVLEPHRAIFKTLADKYPTITKIGFPRGAGFMYKNYATESKCDFMGCDQSVPLEIMKEFQKICGIQGNLDPFLLIAGGDKLVDKTKKLLELYETGNYIFNLGHGILPQTPTEHVKRVTDLIKG